MIFEIQGPDGKTYEVDAPDENAAMSAFQGMSQQAPQPAQDKGPALQTGFSDVWTDEMLFGFPSKAAAGMNALIRAPFTDKTIGEEYGSIRGMQKRGREQYANDYPVRNAAASIGGSIMGAGKLMGAGATATRLVPQAASGLRGMGANIAANAADGAIYGGLSALGHDESIGQGAGIGAVLGGAAYPLIQAGKGIGNAVGGMLGIGNEKRAQAALAEALTRSGKSSSNVVDDLALAARDGQNEFMVADSLGNSGQRMLSGIARSPGDMRQTIAETLQRRQMGQGERLSNALAEGFNAPDTAAQRQAGLAAGRSSLADVNYTNASTAAKPVNLTGAIDRIDRLLGRDPILGETALSMGPMGQRLKAVRDQIQRGGEQLVDFDRIVALKSDMFQQMQRNPDVASDLRPVYSLLDEALERASPQYRAANDAYRAQSRTIDAVDAGKAAASGRTRAADNISTFNGMQPGEQNAFRAGYVDPIIAKIEATSISPTTNKARSLITGKSEQEFPAFAVRQRADKMGRRIAREQRMFETANAALGGSRTADNLADLGEMSAFDPSMIGAIATGNFKGAIVQALTKGSQALQGRNIQTRDMIARALLETSPTRATAELARAVQAGQRLTRSQQTLVRAIIGGSVPVASGSLN